MQENGEPSEISIKDNNATGRSTMQFQFFNEMEQLLGSNHDIDYPVPVTAD